MVLIHHVGQKPSSWNYLCSIWNSPRFKSNLSSICVPSNLCVDRLMSAGPVWQIPSREKSVSCNLTLSHQMESFVKFRDFSVTHTVLVCSHWLEKAVLQPCIYVCIVFFAGNKLQAYIYICIVFCVGNKLQAYIYICIVFCIGKNLQAYLYICIHERREVTAVNLESAWFCIFTYFLTVKITWLNWKHKTTCI